MESMDQIGCKCFQRPEDLVVRSSIFKGPDTDDHTPIL